MIIPTIRGESGRSQPEMFEDGQFAGLRCGPKCGSIPQANTNLVELPGKGTADKRIQPTAHLVKIEVGVEFTRSVALTCDGRLIECD